MELELGFKISKSLDDYSSADLRISKEPHAGPIFVSRELDTLFFLTAHLKGYKKEHIEVEINEDGTQIAISGERRVQEMVMINWQMHKKEPQLRGFRKVFNIPKGVNLDKIKAKFVESDLTISMPKLVKGLRGSKIEEITEEGSLQKENENLAKNDEIVSELILSKENENGERAVEEAKDDMQKEKENLVKENDEIVSELILSKENKNGEQAVEEVKDSAQKENENLAKENDEIAAVISLSKEHENGERVDEVKDIVTEEIPRMESEKQGLESENFPGKNIVGQEEGEKSGVGQQANENRQSNEKASKLCVPMIAGTALIVSIVAFVTHMIRAKNVPTRKKS